MELTHGGAKGCAISTFSIGRVSCGLHKVEPKELAKIPVGTIFGGLESILRRGQQLTMLMT
jgi:hypothetical protein